MIKQLFDMRPTSGTYAIKGFIAKVYACPPCPPGAMCKPCMGDNVVVSDEPKKLNNYTNLTERDLIVFVMSRADLARLNLGEQHRFVVRVKGTKSTSQAIGVDMELIAIDPAP